MTPGVCPRVTSVCDDQGVLSDGSAARSRRPQVVAHRGASQEVPEHTSAAYERALEYGVDALECDVRLTLDGHLVCVHDRRVDRTSNGRGPVSTLELSRLRELDFGSWKTLNDVEAPDTVSAGDTTVLTLERLLDMVAEHPGAPQLAIETKHPNRYAGQVERAVLAALARRGWSSIGVDEPSRVRVMSFSQLALRRIHRAAPQLPTVFLMERLPLRMRDGSLPYGAMAAGPSIGIIRGNPDYVRQVHALGRQVHVWTVDQPEDVALCLDLGVDAIITNRPREVLGQVAEYA